MNLYGKPVIVLGHGVRAAGADPSALLELGVPILTSWQGADLVDNTHPNYMGRPGIYGQRCANKVLYEADQILAIGCRFGPYMIGHTGLRKEQKLCMVDVDRREAERLGAELILQDAKEFIDSFQPEVSCYSWMKMCQKWKAQWDWIEYPTHDDTNGYINSYQFVRRLEPFLSPNEIIVTDDGGNMCPVFQALRVRPPQRILTAGGLGEMGCALPGAIGASFASGGRVTCFIGDGGFMLNVQELATIKHHNLPIKMIVFENDGYSMIKGTYDNLKKARQGVSKNTGLGLAEAWAVAKAFGIDSVKISSWEGFDSIRHMIVGDIAGPYLVQVTTDPEQQFLPRLKPIIENGKITPARFDQLSPIYT